MPSSNQLICFDTTLRDGELVPGVKFARSHKLQIAEWLEEMGVDVIEVGYPAHNVDDVENLKAVSQHLKTATLCGLAGSQPQEIEAVAEAMRQAHHPRLHTYTPVNLKRHPALEEETLAAIQASVALCRTYCDDVEWSAFDATRSDPQFLSRAIDTAIASGATTINIPDSMGLLTPPQFTDLLTDILNRVEQRDRAIFSVHCHDDLGWAVGNSLAALACGVRQIECSINGLGARKGNADWAALITAMAEFDELTMTLNLERLNTLSQFVADVTRIEKKRK